MRGGRQETAMPFLFHGTYRDGLLTTWEYVVEHSHEAEGTVSWKHDVRLLFAAQIQC
jgi:hypothetical protein